MDRAADRARAPAWVRRLVAAYLAAFVVCGLFGVEAWPLTGWRLFADARPARQAGWQAVTADAAGRETPIPFRDLPIRFHGAVRARGAQVEAVRVYRTTTDVSRRVGPRGTPPERSLYWTCPIRGAGAPG